MDMENAGTLRFLRRLVTVLTAVMIVGVITIIVLLVIRLQTPSVTLPDDIALPSGTVPEAITLTQTHVLVVTGGELLIFDRTGQTLLMQTPLP